MPGVNSSPGYRRPDPSPKPDLPTLRKSLVVKLNCGAEYRYPTLDDYVEHYVTQGHVRDLDDLIENHSNLINEIIFNWIATGQLGCLFAVKLADKPREHRIFPIVYLDALTGVGRFLSESLDAAADNFEAAVVIFPRIWTEQDVVQLVNELCNDPSERWYRTDDGIKPDPSGSLTFVGLRWVLKSQASVNFVLGFAPIDSMPITRRSPFSALFFRIREEKRTDEVREDGRVQVHLADLDSTFHPQEVHDHVWTATEAYRADRVEPHMDLAAKAKVTFSVSPHAAKTLCPSRRVIVEKENHGH